MDSRDELIQLLKESLEQQRKLNAELTQQVANLNETVQNLLNKLYGTSSEKKKAEIPGQLNLFNEAEMEADPFEAEPPIETVIEGYIRKERNPKRSHKDILDNLPIKKVVCKVAKEDRYCEWCGIEMEKIGTKYVREELQIIPAKVLRIHYYQEVLGCPECKKELPVIKEAQPPAPLFKHSFASPSTVAYVMHQKYMNAMPLYRQEMDWKQLGVELSRSTMANWIIKAGLEYLKPVFEKLHEHLLEREVLHADETPCQVLKEEGKAAASKSYMWTYLTGDDGLPTIVLYEYCPGRSGDYVKAFLKGFHGFIHCDGYSGYNKLEDVVRVGCMAHCRRYFFEAMPEKKKDSPKITPAEIGYEYCNRLFELEREFKYLDAETKKAKRLEYESPVLKAFWSWIETVDAAGGSRLDKAITYAKNQKDNLMNYLLDGRCAISNNSAERRVKSYVMGRKNFLFHDTPKGAEASSIIYSLVETAKANNLNVYKYLYTVLLYMPDYKNEPEGIEELMPWSDFIKRSCTNSLQK